MYMYMYMYMYIAFATTPYVWKREEAPQSRFCDSNQTK
jgi:hypothetical protein